MRKKVDRGRPTAPARRWGWRSGAPTRPGPTRRSPTPGQSWRPEGEPARLPHEYLRDGTAKALTLFHPADGRVRLQGVTACPNAVLHPWLKRELAAILAAMPDPPAEPAAGWRAAWERWQEGLSIKPTLLGGAAAAADAAGAGQPGRAQDAGVRLLAVRARDHAAVHAGGRVVAEHGREPAADPQAAGAGRPAPEPTPARSSPGSRRRRGTGTRPRRRSCGAASGRPVGGGSASVATASAARGRPPAPRFAEAAARLWPRARQMTH